MTTTSQKYDHHSNPQNTPLPVPPSNSKAAETKGLSLAQKLSLVSLLLIAPAIVQTYNVIRIQQNELSTLRSAQSIIAPAKAIDAAQTALENYAQEATTAKLSEQDPSTLAAGNIEPSLTELTIALENIGIEESQIFPNASFQDDWNLYKESYRHQSVLDIADGFEALFLDYIQPAKVTLLEAGEFEAITNAGSVAPLSNIALNQNPIIRDFILTTNIRNRAQNISELGEYERQSYREDLRRARDAFLALQQSANQIPSDINYTEAISYRQELDAYTSSVENYLQNLEQAVDGNPSGDLELLANDALSQSRLLSDTAINALEADVNQTLSSQRNIQLLNQVLTILLIAAGFILLYFIIRTILQAINNLTRASQRLSRGELNTRVPIISNDELGTVSSAFNTAAAQLQENEQKAIQERLEQEQLQNNIGQFLDVTMDIAEGDLTKRGVVTEDILGNVVDSINLMTEELAYVLGDVQNASKSVTSGSQAMLNTTSQIQEGTAMTATEAQRVAQQVEELTASIRQMAEQAQASADAARQALLASQQGQEAVTGTLDGMQNIRREVQGVAKSIKGLGDRSLEIQEIVDTISGIARQTNLLALNATIEAAGAGEAGGRFSIVADEVRKLADNSAAATNRIANLIQNIQAEIQDVVVNVEESTREVEQGYRVAGTAGERLRQIGDLTQQSAQLAENISSATQQQVDGIEQMGNAVQQIAQIAQRSELSVEEGRAAADQLQQLADQLNASLARFRLPS